MYIQLYIMARRSKRSAFAPTAAGDTAPVSLSEARARLSPIVQDLGASGRVKVPIAVRGVVKAYVVSARRLEELEARERAGRAGPRPPRIRGTLEVVSRPAAAEGEATMALEAQALASWERALARRR